MGKQEITLYTDGACSGNPGVGGWACLLMAASAKKELSGAEAQTTNNRMELRAVIEGLKALKWSCKVHIHSDSSYLINAFQQGWLDNWKRKQWRNASGQSVANQDLWQELILLSEKHELVWHKVKGHSTNEYNNRCDALAVEAVKAFKTGQQQGNRVERC